MKCTRQSTSVRRMQSIALDSERAELASQQELLLAALLEEGVPPPAMSQTQVLVTANSLFRKRSRYIARCIPDMAMDELYVQKMREYTAKFPGSHPDGICRDAAAFLTFCNNKKSSDDDKSVRSIIFRIFARLKSRR